jgi:hypothetical protein
MARYLRKHWRVVQSEGFSFNTDRIPYFVEYRWWGIWFRVPDPDRVGYLAFASNADAVQWIETRSPRSIRECPTAPIMKPEGWNERELASGRYGRQAQADALTRLAQR